MNDKYAQNLIVVFKQISETLEDISVSLKRIADKNS